MVHPEIVETSEGLFFVCRRCLRTDRVPHRDPAAWAWAQVGGWTCDNDRDLDGKPYSICGSCSKNAPVSTGVIADCLVNSAALARIVTEEARASAQKISYSDAPDLADAEKYQRLLVECPLPGEDAMAYVVGEVFWASLLTEEGRPCRPRLLHVPQQPYLSKFAQEILTKFVHVFSQPLPLTREHLRKISPAAGKRGYITWQESDSGPMITGIYAEVEEDRIVHGLKFAVPKSGWLDVDWHHWRLLSWRAGRLDRFSQQGASAGPWHPMSGGLTHHPQIRGLEFFVVLPAIKVIADAGHGGALWLVGTDHVPDGINVGYPVLPTSIRLLDRNDSERFVWQKSVGYLASVDGAVLVSAEARVVGFGAFIELPPKLPRVWYAPPHESPRECEAEELGGGRHRSAIAFCNKFKGARAVVVSEDGRITLFWSKDGLLVCGPLPATGDPIDRPH